MRSWPIVVVGAGAAGLLAATFAARAKVRVLLVDSRRQPGAKIRVSGGGRCNVLPSEACLADFETRGSGKAMRNMLGSWPRAAVQAFFEGDLGLPLVREPSGKLFPASQQSRDVVAALLSGLAASGAETLFDCKVSQVAASTGGGFVLTLASGERISCQRLVLATGGLSMPKTGSDGSGWRMLRALGHRIVPPAPALVPLHGQPFGGELLAGLSVPARLQVHAGGQLLGQAKGDFLFTHRGYSGPVVLDVSRHWTLAQLAPELTECQAPPARASAESLPARATLTAAWGAFAADDDPAARWQAALQAGGRASAQHVVQRHLPRRLADAVIGASLADHGHSPDAHRAISVHAAPSLPKALRRSLLTKLCSMALPVSGSEGYRTAEITAGGVALEEVVTGSLESRLQPGLHLCGETLDVTGRLGGFNFLWAWVTGRRAGEAAARACQWARLAS